MSLLKDKQVMRATAKALRARAAAATPDAGDRLARHAGLLDRDWNGVVVAGYAPIGSEIDPRPWMQTLVSAGAVTALPVMRQEVEPLVFRRWSAGDPLEVRRHDVSEPLDTAPLVRPDVVLVPLLAFDRRGHRLGYGAGYYDRTISDLQSTGRVWTIGLAYSAQEVDRVPVDGFDQAVDAVVTETGIQIFT